MTSGARKKRTPRLRGPEEWKTASGIPFSQWDRWVLLVATVEYDGDWEALRQALEKRRGRSGHQRDDAEAKLSHLKDLRERLVTIEVSARRLLGDDVEDKRIMNKARTKVLEQYVGERDKTKPMWETPRRLLRERALHGNWREFAVSPARFEPVFASVVERRDFYPKRATFSLCRRMESALTKESQELGESPAGRLALHRAFLNGMLSAMDRADDSFGALGELFQWKLPEYFNVPWNETGVAPDVYYRDFLEFATWEDYGLTWHRLGSFFEAVDPAHVETIESSLRALREELLSHSLGYKAERALTLIGELHVAQRSFARFAELAREMGSREWERITTMAETAGRAGRDDLVLEIFAAADQPGFHREHLRDECGRMTGCEPPPWRPQLSVVRGGRSRNP
jgi:hypothetical protein